MTPLAAATMLAGYTVALTDPHQQRLAILLRQRGAATVEVPLLHVVPGHRDARLRTATRHCVHAPVDYAVAATATGWLRWFDAAAAWNLSEALLAALGGAAIRRGHRNGLLRALATDVVVASADAESAGPFLEWDIPVCWTPDDGPDALARLLTEALVARRREFRAADARFAVQGDAVLVDGATIRLAPGPAAVMRVLTDHPGHTLSRANSVPCYRS